MAIPRFFRNADEELVEYDGTSLSWRVSAYTIIVKNEQLLIIKDKTEKLHDIPGGGIEMTESIAEGLKREALEEAGAHIALGELIHIAEDYFYHAKEKKFFKTIQLFYSAELLGELETPHHDTTAWAKFVPLTQLTQYPLPKAVRVAISKYQGIT